MTVVEPMKIGDLVCHHDFSGGFGFGIVREVRSDGSVDVVWLGEARIKRWGSFLSGTHRSSGKKLNVAGGPWYWWKAEEKYEDY